MSRLDDPPFAFRRDYVVANSCDDIALAGFRVDYDRPPQTVGVLAAISCFPRAREFHEASVGGPSAPLEIADSIPGVIDAIAGQAGKSGLRFLDYKAARFVGEARSLGPAGAQVS